MVGGRKLVGWTAALVIAVLAVGAAELVRADREPDGQRAVSIVERATTTTTAPTTTAPPTTAAPTTTTAPRPVIPDALVPIVAGEAAVAAAEPVALAEQIVQAEMAIRDPNTTPEVLAAAGRLQQVAYRRLGENPAWEQEVFAHTPPELHESIWRQATARREFRAMHTRLGENLPAWRIVEPLPAEELLAIYREAEARFGVPWNVLAAVNLVETAMGRIVGLSSAGAQGPMQFMPPTWEAYGMGGDVWDTHDAVMGAANYLAANGGNRGTADGVANALFHYNRSNHYVRGVMHYAEVMRLEPHTFLGLHAWPVMFATAHGDIVLPTGYEQLQPIPVLDWLAANS